MIDNDPNNQEYKLDDLDLLASEPEEQLQSEDESTDAVSKNSSSLFDDDKPWEHPLVRKTAMGIGGFLLLIMVYKIIHSMWSGSSSTEQIKPVAVKENTFKQPQQTQQFVSNLASDPQTSKKLNTLEQTQNNMSVTLQTVNNQVSSMNAQMSDVSSKIAALTDNLTALNQKLDAQTQEIERLTTLNAKQRVKPMRHVIPNKSAYAPDMYSLQALIPGRAWLISSSGTSMTIREGSSVPGYGVVKVIDVERGRVLMSSGRIIKFGQIDS